MEKKNPTQKEKPLALSWGRRTPSECTAGCGRSQWALMLLSLAIRGRGRGPRTGRAQEADSRRLETAAPLVQGNHVSLKEGERQGTGSLCIQKAKSVFSQNTLCSCQTSLGRKNMLSPNEEAMSSMCTFLRTLASALFTLILRGQGRPLCATSNATETFANIFCFR